MLDTAIKTLAELGIKFKEGKIDRRTYETILEELKKKASNKNKIKEAGQEGNRLP